MRPWMLTLTLAGAAAAATLLAPTQRPIAERTERPRPEPPVTPTAVQPSGPAGSLALSATLDQGVLLAGTDEDRFLLLTVKAPEPEADLRMPVDVSIVMDCSGSMSGWRKIDYARQAARELVSSLQPGDRVSLVTFSDRARVLLPAQEVVDRDSILSAIARIHEGGGTNMYDGLTTGLEQLRSGGDGYVRRMLLLSDGHANVGISDATSLSRLAGQAAIADVSTSTIGLGLDFNEDLLASMADAGGGSYHFVDDAQQLAGIFSEELHTMTRTVARDVTLRLDLPAGVRVAETYGYTDTTDGHGWRVYLGDIYAGQERKVVVRLDLPTPTGDSLPLASVSLSYQDLDLGQPIRNTVELAPKVTRNAARAAASLDQETAVQAARAQAAVLAEQAARAFQARDATKARAALARTSSLLKQASIDFDAPELMGDEQDYMSALPVYAGSSPDSEEGMRALKVQKEAAREYAH
ncbi:MAG: VWA domain-containing protein [Pseudomonadota bacterium]